MARVRAVVTLPFTSGLPEDVAINTFHFLTTTSPASAGEIAEIITDLTAFYNSDFGTPGDPLSSYISTLVARTANACAIELFDIDDPEPRQPIGAGTFTLGAPASTTTQATEVAIVASFQADPISGIPQARRRGRVYVGPLTDVADINTTGRPTVGLTQALADAMEGMFNLLPGSGVVWTVYSRVGDAMSAVTNGWVDDEFDTMRSRGRKPLTRTLWP